MFSWIADNGSWLLSLVALPPSATILDLGCGKGADLVRFGESLGHEARLIGLDISEPNIAQARVAAADDPRCAFHTADAETGIPLDDASVDLVYSINVLECIPDKQALLREMHRVLRPGGQVICAHYDWDSQTFDGDDKALVRKLTHTFGDWQQAWMRDCDAWMGRRLWSTFQESGLFEGAIKTRVLMETRYEPDTYGWNQAQSYAALVRREMIGEEEYRAFLDGIERLAAADRYFFSITMFAFVGTAMSSRSSGTAEPRTPPIR